MIGGWLRCVIVIKWLCGTLDHPISPWPTLQKDYVRAYVDANGRPVISFGGYEFPWGPGPQFPPVNELGVTLVTNEWWLAQVRVVVCAFVSSACPFACVFPECAGLSLRKRTCAGSTPAAARYSPQTSYRGPLARFILSSQREKPFPSRRSGGSPW